MLKDLVNEDEDNLDNYDPQSELEDFKRQLSNNSGQKNIGQTRDTWKMNYKLKNQGLRKVEKDKLIKEVVVPKLREMVADQEATPLVEDTKNLIKQIDEYQDHSQTLDKSLADATK